MTYIEFETRVKNGEQNCIYVAQPRGETFRVYVYSSIPAFNEMLNSLDIWGRGNTIPKTKIKEYELDKELYDLFKTKSIDRLAKKYESNIIFEEDLRENSKNNVQEIYIVETCQHNINTGNLTHFDSFNSLDKAKTFLTDVYNDYLIKYQHRGKKVYKNKTSDSFNIIDVYSECDWIYGYITTTNLTL